MEKESSNLEKFQKLLKIENERNSQKKLISEESPLLERLDTAKLIENVSRQLTEEYGSYREYTKKGKISN